MECECCFENNKELFSCGNADCTYKTCRECLINWFKNNSIDDCNYCPACKQNIDYGHLKEILDEKTNKEFVKMKQEQLFNMEKLNIDKIGCFEELFDKFVDTKLTDIISICKRGDYIKIKNTYIHSEKYGFGIEQNEVERWKNIKKQSIQNKIYSSYIALMNEYNKQTEKLVDKIINELESDDNIIPDDQIPNSMEQYHKRRDFIIDLKKQFFDIAYPLIKGAVLESRNYEDDRYLAKNSEILLFSCPDDKCVGYVVEQTHRCNLCNTLCCIKCRTPMYTHEVYDFDEDIKYIDREIDYNNKELERNKNPKCSDEIQKLKQKRNEILAKKEKKDYFNSNYEYTEVIIREHKGFIIDELNKERDDRSMKQYPDCDCLTLTCNREIYETCKYIMKDSKQCPKCNTYIHKTEGCDQMFCTNCHSCFNWKTLIIINPKHVHNPHLIEYIKTKSKLTMKDFQDIRCDMLSEDFIVLLQQCPENQEEFKKIEKYYRLCNEVKDFLNDNIIRNYHNEKINELKRYRIDIMTLMFDYDICKNKKLFDECVEIAQNNVIQKLYTIYHKTQAMYIIEELYQTFAQCLTDLLLKLQYNIIHNEVSDRQLLVNEINNWVEYMNVLINKNIKTLTKFPDDIIYNMKLNIFQNYI